MLLREEAQKLFKPFYHPNVFIGNCNDISGIDSEGRLKMTSHFQRNKCGKIAQNVQSEN